MIREIYCKLPTDINYEPQLESDDDITNILQQIKVILGTKPYEVLGSPEFGLDIQKYLFTLNYNENEIKYEILNAMSKYLVYNSTKYDVSIDLNFGHDTTGAYEYAVLDIAINGKKYMGIFISE